MSPAEHDHDEMGDTADEGDQSVRDTNSRRVDFHLLVSKDIGQRHVIISERGDNSIGGWFLFEKK